MHSSINDSGSDFLNAQVTDHTITGYQPGYFPGESHNPAVNPSIRDRLEADAWAQHPVIAERLARQRQSARLAPRKLRWQDRTLLIVGIVLLAMVLLRIETAVADGSDWGLQLRTPTWSDTEVALDTDVFADISGLIARVEVTQVFQNRSLEWAEGIYRFPLPDGAAVDRLRIEVGGRIIEGEIQERDTARRVYQQAASTGKVAALVEQQKTNRFETRLANIGPGEEIRVTIGFLQNIRFGEGGFSFRLPMTFTPGPGQAAMAGNSGIESAPLSAASSRGDLGLQLEVLLRTGIGFASIESRYHDVDIEPVPAGYRVSLGNEGTRSDRDFELAWYPDLQSVPKSSLVTWDGGDAVYAQLMLVPPLPGSILPQAREVVFIIDTSGSMEGDSIRQARAALLQGLSELSGHDYFNLVEFNSDTTLLFPQSVPASRLNLVAARGFIEDLEANGGTVMAPALHAALTLPEQPGLFRQVIFVTDGSVGNEQELLTMIGDKLGDSRLFTVGIGSAPNTWFMRKSAEIGRGSHTHISKQDEVEERMALLWSHIRVPALSDICVDWGADAEYYPEIIPDMYAGEPLWVVARLPLQPSMITVCGQFNGQYWENASQPFSNQGPETLSTLWARRKIEALEDSMLFGADRELVNQQIKRVALDYGLLTSQTSLVAVDRTPARLPGEPLAQGNIPGLLPAGSTGNVTGFPQTAAGWKARLLLSLLSLLIVSWMFWFSPAIGKKGVIFKRGQVHLN